MPDKTLTARFSATDQISPVMERIAATSERLLAAVNRITARMDAMSSSVTSGVDRLVAVVERMQSQMDAASSAADDLSDRTQAAADASQEAAAAAEEQANAMNELAQTNVQLSDAIASATDTQQRLNDSLQSARDLQEQIADSDQVSAEAKEELADALQQATEAQDNLAQGMDRANEAQQHASEIMASGTATTEEIAAANAEAAEAANRLAEADRQAAEATQRLDAVSEDIRGSLGDMEDGLRGVGEESEQTEGSLQRLIETALGAIAFQQFADYLGDCINKSAEFGEALAKVSTIADTSRASMEDIKAGIQQISRETGDSVTDLTEATYQAISASVDTADAVEFTAQAAKLATAGFTEQSTAVDVLSTALNAYGLAASEVESVSDMLVTTQNLGKTSVDELAQSMGRVIPLAAAYHVQMDQLSSAYADLTKQGIQTAEATTYLKGMFNELGSASSEVGAILLEETGQSFSQLMDSGASLGEVLQILGDHVGGSAEAFQQLWSSQEAGIGALALYNEGADAFNSTLAAMQSSVGATESAFQKMESTTADALGDMSNAFDNLGIAVGDAMTPLAELGAGILTTIITGITGIADACPWLVSGLAAAGAAFGVFSLAVKTGILQIEAAAGPIGWIVAGLGALVGVIASVCDGLDDENSAFRNATPVAQEYANALSEAEAKLADMEASGSAATEEIEAQRAAVEVARSEYESMYQTMDDYQAHVAEVVAGSEELRAAVTEDANAVEQNAENALAYIDRLAQLGSQSENTSEQMALMNSAASKLNEIYPELGASAEMFLDNAEQTSAAMKAQVAEFEKAEAIQTYADHIQELTDNESNLQTELDAAQQELVRARQAWEDAPAWERAFNIDNVASNLGTAEQLVEDLGNELRATTDEIRATESEYQEWADGVADAAQTAFDGMSLSEQGALVGATALQGYKAELQNLCQAYDDTYNAALSSMQGQFGLFDDAKSELEELTASTAETLQTALDGQLAYWEQVQANTEKVAGMTAESLGVTQEAFDAAMPAIMENDAAIAALADAAPGEAAQIINTYADIQTKMSETADAKADFLTGFTEGLAEMQTSVDDAILGVTESMDGMKDGAEQAAVAYVHEWIAGIQAEGPGMATEALTHATQANENITTQFSEAADHVAQYCGEMKAQIDQLPTEKTFTYTLETVGSISAPTVPGHARGTLSAPEDIFIAGEEGPELIIGGRGARVFPADETNDILSALDRVGETNTTADNITQNGTSLLDMMDEIAAIADARLAADAAEGKGLGVSAQQIVLPEVKFDLGEYWHPNENQQPIIDAYERDVRVQALVDAADLANRTPGEGWLTALVRSVRDLDTVTYEAAETVSASPVLDLGEYWTPNDTPVITEDRTESSSAPLLDLGEYWHPNDNSPSPILYPAPDTIQSTPASGTETASGTGSDHTISININGEGNIRIPGGVSKDEIAQLIANQIPEQVKGTLLSILKQESLEEGDRAYVF